MLLALSGSAALVAEEPKEIGNSAMWVTTEDYPFEALRADMEGMTAVQLSVSPKGEPAGCTVTVSSGHKLLDDTTCNLLLLRARFEPAKDRMGRAIGATYSRRVRWQMPKDDEEGRMRVPPPQPYSITYEYDVAETGLAENCRVVWSAGMPAGLDPCEPVANVRYEPFRDEAGQLVRKRVTYRHSMTVEGVSADKLPPPSSK